MDQKADRAGKEVMNILWGAIFAIWCLYLLGYGLATNGLISIVCLLVATLDAVVALGFFIGYFDDPTT